MTTDFGKIKTVDIKDIWKHETHEFTPWLADNLPVLGEVIGINLELIDKEVKGGDFAVDILAKDVNNGRKVVIENQLKKTNHEHLGQLITYASHHEAELIIWLSVKIRKEHKAAIDWLNDNTGKNLNFFAVQIEVIQIDDSKHALNFKLKASPKDWRKSAVNPPGKKEISPKRKQKRIAYKAFYQTLIDELRTKHKFTNAAVGRPRNWYVFPTGIGRCRYRMIFAQGKKVRVAIGINLGKAGDNKKFFKELESQKQNIEEEYGASLEWEILENKKGQVLRIAIYRQGSIDEDETTLTEIKDWCIEQLLTFKKVFLKRLQTATDKTN